MVIHVNTYGHMQLESLTMEIILVIGTVHVLLLQDKTLLFMLTAISTVNLEQKMIMMLITTTSTTHCGTVQVVLLTIHVVPTLTNHGSIIS